MDAVTRRRAVTLACNSSLLAIYKCILKLDFCAGWLQFAFYTGHVVIVCVWALLVSVLGAILSMVVGIYMVVNVSMITLVIIALVYASLLVCAKKARARSRSQRSYQAYQYM